MIKKPRPKKAAIVAAKGKQPKGRKPKREALQKRIRPEEKSLMSSEPKAPAAAAGDRPQTQAQIRYVDRADMGETFADSISGLIFHGQTLRIEFSVTRFDEMKTNTPITGRRYPACRLV